MRAYKANIYPYIDIVISLSAHLVLNWSIIIINK